MAKGKPGPPSTNKIVQFIDTSKCIGCKACQVSCKQWHSQPSEATTFTGSYTNPPDVSGITFTRIGFSESVVDGRFQFLMYKKQCLHCNTCKCASLCPDGVITTAEGFVLFTEACIPKNVKVKGKKTGNPIDLFIAACPYNIPRYDEESGRFVKCDFCYDRYDSGVVNHTACAQTCPPGAIVTGPAAEITALAQARLAEVRVTFSQASLLGNGSVIYLLTEGSSSYIDMQTLDFEVLTSDTLSA
ncbi:MAG: 4Fe-4S dicluster domain-containing protein [Desulfobulbaceae bacterium]|nr:4Fe-4S dicluster domain-containing protein [Desulfobulbaceae bacterium]